MSKYLKWLFEGFRVVGRAWSTTDWARLEMSVARGPEMLSESLGIIERGFCFNFVPFYNNSFKHLSNYRLYTGLHEFFSSSIIRTANLLYYISLLLV
jgi:hypothetical protein